MANTVSILTYDNTFADWVIATNNLISENNDLAANNYTKPTGTLFLNDTSKTGLVVANNAVVQGQLQVQGIGSSAYIQRNLQVDGQSYFTNPSLSIVVAGQANVSGPILAMGSANGLIVSNNTTIGGNISIARAASIGSSLNVGSWANVGSNLYVGANTYTLNAIVYYNTLTGTLTVTNNGYVGDSLTIVNNTNTNYLLANNKVTTRSVLSIIDVVTGVLQANNSVNTEILTTNTINCLNNTYVKNLQANVSINTSTLSVTSNANIASLIVTGTSTLVGKANTGDDLGVGGNQYVSGSQTVVGNHTVNGSLFVDGNATLTAKANTTNDLGVGKNLYVSGNTSVTGNQVVTGSTILTSSSNTANDFGIGGCLYTSLLKLPNGGSIIGDYGNNGASITSYSLSVGAGGLSVAGNFIINGATVYNTNQFTLSSATPNPTFAYLGVYRSLNGSSNSYIRWNESQKYWDLTANNATEPYFRILTDQYISNSGTLNSNANVASSQALSVANTFLQTTINSANTQLKSYTDGAILSSVTSANTQLKSYTDGLVASSVTSANTQLKTYTDSAIVSANTQLRSYTDGAIASANTQLKSYTDGRFVNPSFTGSGAISGDFSVTGNLTITGTTTTLNVSSISSTDSLIKLASNNSSDIVDIGFYGQYASAGTKYSGLIREGSGGANAGTFYLFKDLTTEPAANNVVNYASLTKASLVADGSLITGISGSNIITGTIPTGVTWNGNTVGINFGGTGSTTSNFTTNTLTYFDGSRITSLANPSSSGTWGTQALVPQITIDAYGRVTAVSNVAISVPASYPAISSDISSATTYYPAMALTSSGNLTTAYVSHTKLQYVPTSGTLSAVTFNGSWGGSTIDTTRGGTGLTSFNSGGAVYATSTSALTTGTLPISAGGTGTTSSTGTGSLVLSSSPTLSGTITGGTFSSGTWNGNTIGTGYGGTGLTTFTSGGAVYATSTSALTTGTLPISAGGTGTTSSTGTGTLVLASGPTITSPTLSGTITAGTFSSGTWNGSVIGATYGGTGVNNGTYTLTLGASVNINQNLRTTDSPQFAQPYASKGYREGIVTIGTVATATNLDLSQGNVFNVTLGASGIAFTFTNPPAAGSTCYITVILKQDPTGSRTYGSFGSSIWTDGVRPVLSTGANKIDVLTFMTVDGGASYFGSFAMANLS